MGLVVVGTTRRSFLRPAASVERAVGLAATSRARGTGSKRDGRRAGDEVGKQRRLRAERDQERLLVAAASEEVAMISTHDC